MDDIEIEENKKEPVDRDDYLEVKSRNRVVKSLEGPGWDWYFTLLEARVVSLLELATSEQSTAEDREKNLYRYWEARRTVATYSNELEQTNEYLRTHRIG